MRLLFITLLILLGFTAYRVYTVENTVIFNDKMHDLRDQVDTSEVQYDFTTQPRFYEMQPCVAAETLAIPEQFETDYHPVVFIQSALNHLCHLQKTRDKTHLEKAEYYADKLWSGAHRIEGLPFFPYLFDYKIWKLDTQQLHAPWYSGMAQGQALSLYSWLYQLTNKNDYKDKAMRIFTTLLPPPAASDRPWVSYYDEKGYFWIEEYPFDEQKINVLNGFLFGVFGLYDFAQINQDDAALALLNESLQTAAHYLPKWRNPGDRSFYDLKFKRKAPNFYQALHVEQIRYLHLISGDDYFQEQAEIFKHDYEQKPIIARLYGLLRHYFLTKL